MSHSLEIVGIVVGAVALATAGAALVGSRLWNRVTARAVDRLVKAPMVVRSAQGAPLGPSRYWPEQLVGLPGPVVRYFEYALTPGQALVTHARIIQTGTFARARDAWCPFSAVEDFTVSPPGFVWDARIRMAPCVTARVRDGYVAGEGSMHAALAGLVPLVHQRGTPEIAAGALLRYLAEAVWLPTALLPAAGIRWQAVDERTARATLSDGETTVSMDVRFGAQGEIVGMSAQRYRDVDGRAVLTPWEGRVRDYSAIGGMMVPLESEVGWALPDGLMPYFRARNVTTVYQFRSVASRLGAAAPGLEPVGR